jgi:hypothetical protein
MTSVHFWQAYGFNEKETSSPGKFLNLLELTNSGYVMSIEGQSATGLPGSPHSLNWMFRRGSLFSS